MNCNLCPNNCNIDRTKKLGACKVGDSIKIAKYYLHPYEEDMISGKNGSGTVFFCGCSLGCVFCQNFELSRNLTGKEISVDELVDIFIELENKGAHNINLVTATHYAHKIILALEKYKPKIPVVYNTHGYENLSNLKELDRYIDVYLPDLKYFSPDVSQRYTGKKDYFKHASLSIEFMMNKPIVFGEDNMLKSGTIIRHLVLPQNTNDSIKILDWFSNFKDKAYLNIMSQYTPFGDLSGFPELTRRLTKREYEKVVDYAISLGIEKAFYQKFESADKKYIPKWDF